MRKEEQKAWKIFWKYHDPILMSKNTRTKASRPEDPKELETYLRCHRALYKEKFNNNKSEMNVEELPLFSWFKHFGYEKNS